MRGWSVGVLFSAGLALAQPPLRASSLVWTAPPECPDQAQVVARVEQFLQQALDQATRHPLLIRGQVNKSAAGVYHLQLEFVAGDRSRYRVLTHGDCARLAEAASLLAALAIDPERVHVSESLPLSVPQQQEGPIWHESSGERSQNAPPASPANPRPTRGNHGSKLPMYGLVAGSALTGVLPGVAPNLGIEAGLSPSRRLRFGITGNYAFASTLRIAAAPGAQASFSMWSLGVHACWVRLGKWEFATCIAGETGRITGQGAGVVRAATAADNWAATHLGLRETLYLSDTFGFMLGAQMGVSLLQPRFGIEGLGEVYRPRDWMARAALGMVTILP